MPGVTNGTRLIALVGPAGAGKTSLAEAMLFASGTTDRQGSTANGSSIADSSPEARARGVLRQGFLCCSTRSWCSFCRPARLPCAGAVHGRPDPPSGASGDPVSEAVSMLMIGDHRLLKLPLTRR